MPEPQYVPLQEHVATVKMLLALIHNLAVEMQVQRVALMNAKPEELPLSAEYLKELHAKILADPRFRATKEAIELVHTAEDVDEVLRKLSGLS